MRVFLSSLKASIVAILLAVFCGTSPARAQAITTLMEPIQDENNVDLVSGFVVFKLSDIEIGTGQTSLTHTMRSRANFFDLGYGFLDEYAGGIQFDYGFPNPCSTPNGQLMGVLVEVDGGVTRFCQMADGSFSGYNAFGAVLEPTGPGQRKFTNRDGDQFFFEEAYSYRGLYPWRLVRIERADGQIVRLNYQGNNLAVVQHSGGLQFRYMYDDATNPGRISRVIGVNTAIDYCSPNGGNCVYSREWPVASYQWDFRANGSIIVTDSGGGVTRYQFDGSSTSGGRVHYVKPPGANQDTVEYLYCPRLETSTGPAECTSPGQAPNVPKIYGGGSYANRVYRVVRNGKSWRYSLQIAPPSVQLFNFLFSEVRDDEGNYSHVPSTFYVTGEGGPSSIKNTRRLVNMDYRSGLVTHVTQNDSYDEYYTYGGRGDVIEARRTKAGLTDTIMQASYPVDCPASERARCNKPIWVRDARGGQTDYTYNIRGQVTSVTNPPDANGIRAQTRYFYTERYAWARDASGGFSRSPTPISVLTTERSCRAGSAAGDGCALPGDEVVTNYDYGPDSGPNNLWLRGKAVSADGQTLRTCYAYDALGNKISETAPAANLATCS